MYYACESECHLHTFVCAETGRLHRSTAWMYILDLEPYCYATYTSCQFDTATENKKLILVSAQHIFALLLQRVLTKSSGIIVERWVESAL